MEERRPHLVKTPADLTLEQRQVEILRLGAEKMRLKEAIDALTKRIAQFGGSQDGHVSVKEELREVEKRGERSRLEKELEGVESSLNALLS